MTERVTTGLTGRNVVIGLIAVAAVLAAGAVAVSAHRDKPMITNAVGSASSDLAASAEAHR